VLFLLFQLGSDFYALDASEIVEVLPLVNIRKSLSLPQQFTGTINYRGAFVPVVDLSELIVGRAAPRRTNTRIILARYATEDGKPMLVGLIAEMRPQPCVKSRPTLLLRESATTWRPILVRSRWGRMAVFSGLN
jgi:hypothetical protein